MKPISNVAKARETAERASAWAQMCEAQGKTAKFLHRGALNRSLVAKTLGFPRSSWGSNDDLKALAKRLDAKWGTVAPKDESQSSSDDQTMVTAISGRTDPRASEIAHLRQALAQKTAENARLKRRIQELEGHHERAVTELAVKGGRLWPRPKRPSGDTVTE